MGRGWQGGGGEVWRCWRWQEADLEGRTVCSFIRDCPQDERLEVARLRETVAVKQIHCRLSPALPGGLKVRWPFTVAHSWDEGLGLGAQDAAGIPLGDTVHFS